MRHTLLQIARNVAQFRHKSSADRHLTGIGFIGCILVLLPLLLGFSPDIVNNIDVVAIHDIQFRQENGKQFLDAIIVIRNANANDLKMENGAFDLAIAVNDSDEISLGTANVAEIVLPAPEAGASDAFRDTDVPVSLKLTQKSQVISQALLSKKEILALLGEATPKLNLHFQAKFDLGIKSEERWVLTPGIGIDWIVTPVVQKDELAKLVYTMTADAGKGAQSSQNPSKPSSTPVPDIAESPQPAGTIPPSRIIVYFASGSTKLDNKARALLKQWAQNQPSFHEATSLYIEGHADSSGTPEKNLRVSAKRAGAVYAYLINDLNLAWEHVIIKGMGADDPTEQTAGFDTQANQRRVEIYAVPIP